MKTKKYTGSQRLPFFTAAFFSYLSTKRLSQYCPVIILFSFSLADAQTRSIAFRDGSWNEIRTQAAEQNKLIFLDAYASWCGICKKMDKSVFTNDSVADFFNARFINAKIDMEKAEGPGIARQYNVNVYPGLLFIDAKGNLVHRASGAHDAQELLALARAALNPDRAQEEAVSPSFQNDGPMHSALPRLEIGIGISQLRKDFGLGLSITGPYIFRSAVAVKAAANIQWFENFNGTENVMTTYHNFRLGFRGRGFVVTDNIAVYGEGGAFMVLPNKNLSTQSFISGGFGLLGFEFRINPALAYMIELGGAGTGARADKVPGKPRYASGFMINAGMRFGF